MLTLQEIMAKYGFGKHGAERLVKGLASQSDPAHKGKGRPCKVYDEAQVLARIEALKV